MKPFIPSSLLACPALLATVLALPLNVSADECPDWLNHNFRQLHSDETFNICQAYPNKALLIVNTASHCGFTPQFSGLEALYKQYKDKGLAVIGFASNDFYQAAKDEKTAAGICYENFGVSFKMAAPIKVKGQEAHPLFKALAESTQAPSWNFNKYIVSADRKQVTYFGSTITPESDNFRERIAQAVKR